MQALSAYISLYYLFHRRIEAKQLCSLSIAIVRLIIDSWISHNNFCGAAWIWIILYSSYFIHLIYLHNAQLTRFQKYLIHFAYHLALAEQVYTYASSTERTLWPLLRYAYNTKFYYAYFLLSFSLKVVILLCIRSRCRCISFHSIKESKATWKWNRKAISYSNFE